MIVRTDAVVLRTFDYGETSQIVTLFTRQHGVISVLAKGARRPKSRFGATLQPMAYVQAVYYFKENRGLQTLKETAHVARFTRLPVDLDRVTTGLRLIELSRALLHENDPHPPAFNLLVHSLTWLDATEAHAVNVLPWFQLHLAALLGFNPDVQRDDVEDLPDEGGLLLLDSGTIATRALPGRGGQRASRAALRAFAIFTRTDLDTSGRLNLDEATRQEVESLADAYLRVHTEGTYPERVRRVAGQMADGLAPPSAEPFTEAS